MNRAASTCGTFAAALVFVSTIAGAQTWKAPAEGARCPSKWGTGDERGAANHVTPAAVLNAARLIRTGEVIELGLVLRAGMPIQATRRFDLHTKRTFMNPQSNQRGSNEEIVTTELGQVGTQFDGFATRAMGTVFITASRSATSRRVPASPSSASKTSGLSWRAAC